MPKISACSDREEMRVAAVDDYQQVRKRLKTAIK